MAILISDANSNLLREETFQKGASFLKCNPGVVQFNLKWAQALDSGLAQEIGCGLLGR